MSLTMMALRIAAVEALKAGGTLVGSNVLDSQIAPIDQTASGELRTDQQQPFIAVYTDTAKAKDLGRTGLRSNGQVDILFNCGVAMTMAETNRETGAATIVGLPATDADFEAVLDVIDMQICRCLTSPDNPWSQVFGGFVQTYVSKQMLRSSTTGENVRLAAGQLKLTVEVFSDPRLGQTHDATGPWARFLGLLEEHSLPQLGLFELFLGEADALAYPAYETLTGMTTRIADQLKLYPFGGAAFETTIDDPQSEALPQ
jgi:hypothetical protein